MLDLENPSISRICLALDTLIHSSTEDVIPAVQSRLHELLSHNSPLVRRRALFAFRALSVYEPELLRRVTSKIYKRLKDTDDSVVGAALLLTANLVQFSTPEEIRQRLNDKLQSAWETEPERSRRWALLKATRALDRTTTVLVSPSDLVTTPTAQVTPDKLRLVLEILTSSDPQDHYVFVSCLQCLNPNLWAGTDPERPAVLEGWEVERVMTLLDSTDSLIRKRTIDILYRVDPGIVSAYFAQAIQGIPSILTLKEKNEYIIRLLEVIERQSENDGESYAQQLKELFAAVYQEAVPERQPVLEVAVEKMAASSAFRISSATTLIAPVTEAGSSMSSTLMVIIFALASEYTGKLSLPPVDVLRGLASRLASYAGRLLFIAVRIISKYVCPAPVQDACLMSMLRIVVDCEEVPAEVLVLVKELGQNSRRHVRQRCEQFVSLCGQKNLLSDVVARARSPTQLPDFLEELTISTSPSPLKSTRPLPVSPPQSPERLSASLAQSKLRYDAYQPPQVASRLRRPANTHRSTSSNSRSASQSDNRPSLDELSMTVTAGDLALASEAIELEVMSKTQQAKQPQKRPDEDTTSRLDLIAFDSPFLTDPPEAKIPESKPSAEELDFESIWDTMHNSNARGWCDVTIDVVVRKLQGLQHRLTVIPTDLPPFEGDFKILVSSISTNAAIRLRENDDEGCLWRLRCDDMVLMGSIKRIMGDL
ncbi:hypothetical protein HWV62_40641 [Athelia sp. TMB]|nr:hypothetical protein HWV62_40641 [Athelia sp. TMB]